MTDAVPGDEAAPREVVAERGLEHLQAAARELIAASRAFLDVAESVVEEPEVVRDLVGVLGRFGGRSGLGRVGGTVGSAGEDPWPDEPEVEHIPVT